MEDCMNCVSCGKSHAEIIEADRRRAEYLYNKLNLDRIGAEGRVIFLKEEVAQLRALLERESQDNQYLRDALIVTKRPVSP